MEFPCYEKYRLTRLIYEDDERKIYKAEHKTLGSLRLIKEARRGTAAEKELILEAKVLSGIKSQFIPAFFDLEEDEDHICLVEELAEGETLESFLGAGKTVTLSRLKGFLESLCSALEVLHKGSGHYLHCDLKPANLIVCNNALKLVDFGAAVPQGRENLGLVSFGTPSFAAPEQKNGEMRSAATDVYGAGKIAELLCTHFEAGNEGNVRLLKTLKRITDKATDENPGHRFSSMESLRISFEKAFEKNGATGLLTLFRKKEKRRNKSIGFIGTHHGAGTTHTALSLALSLADEGKDVALVDLSENRDLSCFVEKETKREGAGPVRFRGISLYTDADNETAALARNGKYDHCIFDLGCGVNRRIQEFLRCDLKVVVADASPWRRNRRETVERLVSTAADPKDWWLLVNFSERKRPKDLKRLSVNLEWLGFCPDPFQNTVQNEILFGKLLSAY